MDAKNCRERARDSSRSMVGLSSHSSPVPGKTLQGSLPVPFQQTAEERTIDTPTSRQFRNSLEDVAGHWASMLSPSAACVSSGFELMWCSIDVCKVQLGWTRNDVSVHVNPLERGTQHKLSVPEKYSLTQAS